MKTKTTFIIENETELKINNSYIQDVEFINGENLTALEMNGNKILNIKSLENLINLRYISFNNNWLKI